MAKKKQVLYPVVFMIVVASVFTLALAILNELTIETIERQATLKTQSKLLFAFNIPVSDEELDIITTYDKHISEKEIDGITYFEATDENGLIGYAFEAEGSGLWGSIKAYVAFDPQLETLLGIDFISHQETPGLGGRIDELWFREQFRNIEAKDETIIFTPSIGGNVDAISGATLTSKSVKDLLNENIKIIQETYKGVF